MTDVQTKLIELLSEIDVLCRRNELNYFLAGEGAVSAFRSHKFESEKIVLDIYMTLPEVLKLQKLICEENRKDRVFESIYTNDMFPNLVFRYCNRNTLCVNLKRNAHIQSLGICITIKVLRRFAKGRISKLASFLEAGWMYNYVDFLELDELNEEELEVRRKTRILLFFSRKLYKKVMLKCIERTQENVHFGERLYVETIKGRTGKKYVFKKGLFSEIQEVEFEGGSFPIPANEEIFFSALYTRRWREIEFTVKELGRLQIVDAQLPYEYYFKMLEKVGLSVHLLERMRRERKIEQALKGFNERINRTWNYALRVQDQLDLQNEYMPEKQKIKQLYDSGNWNALQDIYKNYDRITRKNYACGLGICFDKELLNIYISILRHNREENYAKKLEELCAGL